MGNHESEDNVWSLVNYDLSIARKGLDRATEGAKAAGSRMAADNAALERLRGILAGRSVPPTAAEVAAHYAAGGKWRVVESECERAPTGRPYKRAAAERDAGRDRRILRTEDDERREVERARAQLRQAPGRRAQRLRE